MEIHFPTYYNTFRCIAADCPDSCCKEWTVDVDPASAAHYRALDGALGDRLRAVLQDTEGGTIMTIENGRCPMWREDSLCRIQAELGHDALCKTCRDFPRLRHDYGDFTELGLELSCPEAARLILTAAPDMQLEILPGENTPEYDSADMEILKTSRQNILNLLDNDSFTLPEVLAVLLLYAHDVQAQIDGMDATTFMPDMLLDDAKRYAAEGNLPGVFNFFCGLEILTQEWSLRLQQAPRPIQWSATLRALARYMVNRYWLQAVSDLDLICRAKFIIIACILVGALGGDPIRTAQLFSKEIENNPDNVEAILDGAYTATALTDTNLFSILLG